MNEDIWCNGCVYKRQDTPNGLRWICGKYHRGMFSVPKQRIKDASLGVVGDWEFDCKRRKKCLAEHGHETDRSRK